MPLIKDAFQPDPWMSLSAVWHFRPNHIEFICEHYELICDGKWPEKKTGYIDILDGKTQIKSHAYFESAINLLAEFHLRIDQCGNDGETFRSYRLDLMSQDEETQERTRRQIIKGRGVDQVERQCKCVRDYIKGVSKSGLNRRQQSYGEFKLSWYDNFSERREKYRLLPTRSTLLNKNNYGRLDK